jgi:alkanesulfonate monooxygenase SsuD/methylene tetrahydromethanopterin reductase-like flavin-dependent oxidoreductase (luciferase family)
MPLSEIRHRVELYREEAAKAGWEPVASDVVYRFFGHVADADEDARRNVGDNGLDLGRFFGMNPAVLKRLIGDRRMDIHKMERPFLCGGPATVVDQVGELREAGVGNLDMAFTWPGLSHEQQLRSMECFAGRVIPQIRAL